ncbi:hypothetical protein Syun_020945 [Stephania yunnanensis]|uniref:Uncharacterized protein n=1 Tax=Stephania yunnanensis TaxID=152371 RepID=A0AAP0IEW1_9MAGN
MRNTHTKEIKSKNKNKNNTNHLTIHILTPHPQTNHITHHFAFSLSSHPITSRHLPLPVKHLPPYTHFASPTT